MTKFTVWMWFALVCLSPLAVRADSQTATLDRLDAQTLRGGTAKRPVLLQQEARGLDIVVQSANASRIQPHVLPIVKQPYAEPRVFFLFLTMSGIRRPELWEAFFDKQPRNKYRVFVHCKNSVKCSTQLGLSGWASQVATVPSTYCKDLVTPMVQLLKSAIHESLSSDDKFVFISDSTLPVKPFSDVYTTLTTNSDSDFCIYPTSHWTTMRLMHNKYALIAKHSQWVVLNQAHARDMVQKWPATKAGFDEPSWKIPVFDKLKKGPWGRIANPAGVLPLPQCIDEYAVFSTIFGALVDDGQKQMSKESMPGYGGLPLQVRDNPGFTAVTQGVCHTFAFWDASEFKASISMEDIAKDAPNTKFSCFPLCDSSHPAEFLAISDVGAAVMRRSHYLFARKFPEHVLSVDQFKRIILSATAPPA